MDKAELAALDRAATQGFMEAFPGANSHCFEARLVVGGECVAFADGMPHYAADGDVIGIDLSPDAEFLMTLWNAYRTGKLVLIGPDAVATVGMALCQSALGPKACPCVEKGEFRCSDAHPGDQARAALAALGVKP
jgi:hypothetical protein